MVLPKVTDFELVVDPTRLEATHQYSPASVDALLFMVSDEVFTFPPEYLVFSVVLWFPPLNTQCISYCLNAGKAWVTLAEQWMIRVGPVSDIIPCKSTVGFSETSKFWTELHTVNMGIMTNWKFDDTDKKRIDDCLYC